MFNRYNAEECTEHVPDRVKLAAIRSRGRGFLGAAIVPVLALGPFVFNEAESHTGLLSAGLGHVTAGWAGPADDSLRIADSLRVADSLAVVALNRAEIDSPEKPVEDVESPAEEVEEREIAIGHASYYGNELAGRRTASGERFDPRGFTAAHRTLPFGSRVRVTNLKNGKSVIVRINDRGPFTERRVIDISHAAAQAIGMIRSGVARVRVDLLETE